MPQKSTEDSLYDLVKVLKQHIIGKRIAILISLDVEGAFDNAWWPKMKAEIAARKCPGNLQRVLSSYLEGRSIQINYAGEVLEKTQTRGCVQGSIAGPTLWNVILDPLIRHFTQSNDVHCQAFADDVVLVIAGEKLTELTQITDKALDWVHKWGLENKLNFSPAKTNAMILTRKHIDKKGIQLKMNGTVIPIVKDFKLLGIQLDDGLTFNNHVTLMCKKLVTFYQRLERAARVTWGLNPSVQKTIYQAVVEPIALYAASVWAPATEKLEICKKLKATQRGFARRICKAYRTVALLPALAVAGLLPLDLRVQEAARLYCIKRGSPLLQLPDREYEARVPYTNTPHPVDLAPLTFEKVEDLSEETVAKYQIEGLRIFTDGSKIEGKVGAAITAWRNDEEIRQCTFRLETYCSVFQSELLAILKAGELAAKLKDTTINIFSDSMSSLQAIENQTCLHPLVFRIREQIYALQKSGTTVRLFWLRAHCGTVGNERADELAKYAALRKKTKAAYDLFPTSYAKRTIREETLYKWSKIYKELTKEKQIADFLPDATSAYRLKSLGEEIPPCLTPHSNLYGSEYAFDHLTTLTWLIYQNLKRR
ncbi:uncharacterized protein LOC134805513 [Cydia splendana]|uniref:uncharacterized protein LOC134805513 n=1 Tax=Cydia splendana TaxID=1100963 RepID=UPI00300CAB6C